MNASAYVCLKNRYKSIWSLYVVKISRIPACVIGVYIIDKLNTRVTTHFTAGSYRFVFKNHSHSSRNAQNVAREYPQIHRRVSNKHGVYHYCVVSSNIGPAQSILAPQEHFLKSVSYIFFRIFN